MGWFSSILLQVKGWFGMIENVVDEVEDALEVAEDVVNVLEDSLEDLADEEVEDK
jgi:hypothetical protein